MNKKNHNQNQRKRNGISAILCLSVILISVILFGQCTAPSREQSYQGLSTEEKEQLTAMTDYLNEIDKIVMSNRQQLDKVSINNSDMEKSLSSIEKKLLSIQENITNANYELTLHYETYSSNASQTMNESLSAILTEQQEVMNQITNTKKEIEEILKEIGLNAEKNHSDTLDRILTLQTSLKKVESSLKKYYSNLDNSIEELHEELEKNNNTLLETLYQIEAGLKTAIDEHLTAIELKIDKNLISLMQELDSLHKQVKEAEKSVSSLLNMMSADAEARQDEIRTAFTGIEKLIMQIASDFKAVHGETKTLIVKLQNSEDENHKETLNVLNAMESNMNENSLQNLNKITESLQFIQDRFDTSMNSIKNEMSQNFDFLNTELSNGLSSFNGSITQKIDNLDLSMTEKYDAISNMILSGNGDLQEYIREQFGLSNTEIKEYTQNVINTSDEEMRNHIQNTVDTSDFNMQEYIQNAVNGINENLEQVFMYVSSGKKELASALTDKGIDTDANAKFQLMATNVRKIGERSDVTAGALLEGFTAYVGNGYITGNMKNQGSVSASLNCGQSYNIPAGYHSGSGKITANSLASQTPATATAENLSQGKTGWVNGKLITGTGADVNTAYNKGYADGMQDALNGADISYTYHQHTGNEQGGGCYTNPVYHTHSSDCNITVQCDCPRYSQGEFLGNHAIDGWPMWRCQNCGDGNWKHSDGRCNEMKEKVSCGKTESSIESYSLGCGKTESTIESATIVFP